SGYTTSPRYATLFWLGDQLVSWDAHDGIKTAVTGLLSSGFSGYAFNHSDIGGYTTITNPIRNYYRSEELLLRWMDLNAFTTVFRTHEGNQPENNAQFYSNETTFSHFARMAKVYAAWGFYRDDLIHEAAETGLPVVRHPFIEYPDDPNVLDIRYEEFMVGSELLVAPVLDPKRDSVSVYLPAGEWVHVWSGETYTGGQRVRVDAPVGQPAVFYPAGSAVGEQFTANLQSAGLIGNR
ncbi:MAG: alpha-glucosidase, partial [Anaerolineae bacterium]|nr:alpha-glucosidase [Anaerolineae bacterium]